MNLDLRKGEALYDYRQHTVFIGSHSDQLLRESFGRVAKYEELDYDHVEITFLEYDSDQIQGYEEPAEILFVFEGADKTVDYAQGHREEIANIWCDEIVEPLFVDTPRTRIL